MDCGFTASTMHLEGAPACLRRRRAMTVAPAFAEVGAARVVEQRIENGDLRGGQPAPQPSLQHGAAHLAGADEEQGPRAREHSDQASPCVSKSTAASASSGALPAQMTNWKAW